MAAYGYLLAGLVMGLFALAASTSLVVAGLCALVGVVAGYAMLPVVALDFADLPMLALAGAVLGLVAASARNQRPVPTGMRSGLLAVVVALCWLIVLPMVTSTPMLHAGAYRALIGPVDTLRNAPDLAPVDPAHVRMVDGRLAERLAERVLGERGALGSQVTVGTMDLQVVRGEWWWVAPLNHAGFFRWLENRKGTPGYVMVSATDSRDVRLVTTLDGAPLAIRHNAGAWLGDVPARHLYANGYATRGLVDFSFEIDDDGRPFLVATEIEHRVGFGGATPVGAVILDVQTGAHTRCAIADCPAWVDLIQPTELVTARINDWGEYVHGWFNPSKKDQLAATAGTARILDRAGHQFHYTGIRSASADRGTTGYMLVDTRTGAATYYLQAGATEEAAMASAAGSVQEKRYVPGFPTPYNINGAWTYLVPLYDGAGFVKAVGFVSVENDQVLAVGDTPEDALRMYRQVLATGGNRVVGDGQVRRARADGLVRRIGVDVRQGNTYYYVWLERADSLAFVATSALSPLLPLTQVGDAVAITYEDGGRGIVDMASFENMALPVRRSEAEARAGVVPTMSLVPSADTVTGPRVGVSPAP